MKSILSALLLSMFWCNLPAQNMQFGWGYTTGSAGEESARGAVTDAAGNTYVTGAFSGTIDFDKGPGVANLSTATGQTKTDAYILKLDVSGNYVWAISIGGTNDADQAGRNIALDSAGNVVVSGFFYGNIMMPPARADLRWRAPKAVGACLLTGSSGAQQNANRFVIRYNFAACKHFFYETARS